MLQSDYSDLHSAVLDAHDSLRRILIAMERCASAAIGSATGSSASTSAAGVAPVDASAAAGTSPVPPLASLAPRTAEGERAAASLAAFRTHVTSFLSHLRYTTQEAVIAAERERAAAADATTSAAAAADANHGGANHAAAAALRRALRVGGSADVLEERVSAALVRQLEQDDHERALDPELRRAAASVQGLQIYSELVKVYERRIDELNGAVSAAGLAAIAPLPAGLGGGADGGSDAFAFLQQQAMCAGAGPGTAALVSATELGRVTVRMKEKMEAAVALGAAAEVESTVLAVENAVLAARVEMLEGRLQSATVDAAANRDRAAVARERAAAANARASRIVASAAPQSVSRALGAGTALTPSNTAVGLQIPNSTTGSPNAARRGPHDATPSMVRRTAHHVSGGSPSRVRHDESTLAVPAGASGLDRPNTAASNWTTLSAVGLAQPTASMRVAAATSATPGAAAASITGDGAVAPLEVAQWMGDVYDAVAGPSSISSRTPVLESSGAQSVPAPVAKPATPFSELVEKRRADARR